MVRGLSRSLWGRRVCDEYCHVTICLETLYMYSLVILSVLFHRKDVQVPTVTSPLPLVKNIVRHCNTSTSKYIKYAQLI
jgi:hypothetical protein